MKLIFVNRYFAPDASATSQLLRDLCHHLARAGHEVHVVASRQLHDRPDAMLPPRQALDGVHVHRVWTTRFGRMYLPGRAIDYLTFYLASAMRLWRLARAGDLIIAKTDPPLISVVGAWIASLRKAALVNWVQDVFPETAQRLGIATLDGPLGSALVRLRDYSLKRAALNVAVGERMADHLRLHAPGAHVEVIHNWSDGALVRPVGHAENPLRGEWALQGSFVVGYSGNLGRAHEFDTVLAACERLKDRPEIVFLFIGSGPQRARLGSEVARRSLGNVRFQPLQPREALGLSLCVPDVHLVTLLSGLEGFVMPSKLYGIAAAGRPVLFIGARSGEIARIVESSRCGVSVETGDVDGLVKAIEALAADAALAFAWGRNARTAFERHFDRPLALARWDAAIARSLRM